ncbi:hypothetical protein Tco_1345380 [Tanacetum coccineum]
MGVRSPTPPLLDTIPSVENLIPIPSELEGISDDTCDVPELTLIMEEIDLISASDDVDATGIEDDDMTQKGFYVLLKEMLNN